MKIGINLLNFESDKIDGVGYLLKSVLHIIQQQNDSHKFLLLVPESFNCEKVLDIHRKDKFDIIRFPKYNNKISRIIYKFLVFPFALNRHSIDVLYSPAPPISPFIPGNIRVVTTINDLSPLRVNRKQGIVYKLYYKFIVKMAINRSNLLVTISDNSKTDLVELFKINPDKIEIMYGFVTGKLFRQYADGNFFIAVSTIQPGKNLERTIEAFKLFLDNHENKLFKLYIIGREGWSAESLNALPAKLGIADNVIFTGYLENDELEWYYQNCAALIYASLYEGFGLPPLEAMYYGKPSVVSNTSSLPEVVGNAGILVNPLKPVSIADGMGKVMDKDIRNRLLSEMPNQLRKFAAEEQVMTLLRIFEKAANCHK